MGNTKEILLPLASPLVAVAPLPAAHRRRPPRRPEDTLPPALALKPPHRRTVAARRRTRQGTRQRQVLLTIIVPSPTYSTTHPLNHSTTHPTTHPHTHPLNHSPTHPLTQPLTHPLTHPLNHSPTQPLTHPPTHLITHSTTHPPTHPPTHSTTHPPTHPLTYSLTQPHTHPTTHPLTHSPTYSLTHPLNHSTTYSPTHSTTHSLTHSTTHSHTQPLNHSLTHLPNHPTTQPLNHSTTHLITHSTTSAFTGRFAPCLPSSLTSSINLEDLKNKLNIFTVGDQSKECEKLLENLTDGLERFLGYDKESKGYDGSGIVYSDLDRLCDGVMSFLHGVLDNIQPKLGLHKNRIDKAIESLNLHKHSGKEGFNAAIGAVVLGVRQYNEGVVNSNNLVKKPIEALMQKMKILNEQVSNLNTINVAAGEIDKAVRDVNQKVEDTTGYAKTFSKGIASAKEDIKDLNDDLELKVKNAKDNIFHEVTRLHEIHKQQKEDLTAVTENVKNKLNDAREQIDSQISQQVTALVEKLKKLVAELLTKLKELDKWLKQYVTDLETRMKEAEEIVKAVGEKVEKILEEVDKNGKHKIALKEAANMIRQKAFSLKEAGEAAKKKAQEELKTALGAVIKMNTALRTDLDDVNKRINQGIREYVTKLGEALHKGMTVAKYDVWDTTTTPGVNALHNAVTRTYKDKLGAFGDKLQQVLQEAMKTDEQGKPNDLGKYIEWFLHDLNKAKAKLVDLKGPSIPQAEDIVKELNAYLMKPVEEQLPTRGVDVDITKRPEILRAYKTHVNQENLLSSSPEQLKGELPDAIKKIETKVTEALTNIQTLDAQAKQQLDHVNEHLDSLCQAITTFAETGDDSAKNKITELKRKIGITLKGEQTSFQKVRDNLNQLREDNLRKAINDAENFAVEAEEERKKTIQELNTHVQDTLESAKSTITNDVKSRYVKFVKSQLTKFADKVIKELGTLPKEITDDAKLKFKGFMGVFQQKLTDSQLPTNLDGNAKLETLSSRAKTFFTELLKTLNMRPQIMDSNNLSKLRSKLDTLFTDLTKYNTKFVNDLSALNTLLTDMHPDSYSHQNNPLLQFLKGGITNMHSELDKAYVSVYDSARAIEWDRKDNPETTYCAKAFLTTVPILTDLMDINQSCMNSEWCRKSVFSSENKGPVAKYLKHYGYDIPTSSDKADGHLRRDITGIIIGTLLNNNNNNSRLFTHLGKNDGLIQQLYEYLHLYYEVSHLYTTSKRHPSSVYEMLTWLTGLPHNPVYQDLSFDGFSSLFDKPKNTASEGDIGVTDLSALHLKASPATFTAQDVSNALTAVCSKAEDVLISILGHGHADGIYAVEFSNNSLNLSYPSSPSQCLVFLADLLYRLYQQLIFLYQQCKHGQFCSGWNKCWYGQGIAGSSWSCNTLQCPNQTGDQNADQKGNQKHNQTCDQKCKQHSDCGIKSPLQSFLEDGLVGFLPHQLTKLGCGVACSLGSHRGQPCITPMGFPDLSAMASHRQTGKYLEEVLYEFCGKPDKPLTQLCSYITCILQRTPQTLGDLFAFYFNFLDKWNSNDGHKRHAFVNAVQSANFGDAKTTLEIGSMFGSSDHSGRTHRNANLHSLVKCEANKGDASLPCGTYLKPICRDIWNTFSSKNSGKYLSWIVYLSETFYDLLKKLYDDCCATCDKKGTRCYEKCCTEKCPVKYTDKNGQSTTPSIRDTHTPDCSSIVKCPHTLRTLSKYGFYFGSSWRMSGERGEKTKRTCRDLCRALDRVLSKKKEDGAALAKMAIYVDIISPLVAVAPVPAAHHRRPPRRPEDTLPLKITLKPPHRRAVPPRRCKEDARKKALKDITDRQTTLNELKEKLKDFIGDENCKNLLTNLTEGLEKFLGYDKTSKGYDGTGIVYSDLDRLCDGVMAFLHSVLKNVCDKQPYKVGKEKFFTEVVSVLEKKLCSGHEGFKDVIAQVATGVGGYNREVERSNNLVKGKIEELQGFVKDEKKGKWLDRVNGLQAESVGRDPNPDKEDPEVSKAKELVQECEQKSDAFNRSFDNRIPNAWNKGSKIERKQEFKDLNPALRDKIENAKKNISYETDRLRTLTKKENEKLYEMTTQIKSTLEVLKRCVNREIDTKVRELVKKINEKVTLILADLKEINETLYKYVEQLRKWINDADGIVDGAIKEARKIADKGLAWPTDDQLKGKVDDLRNKGVEIYGKFESAKNQVAQLVQAAQDKVRLLEEAVRYDLNHVKTQLLTKLAEYVQGYVTEVQKRVNEIIAGESSKSDGLKGIKEKIVQKYAEGFQSDSAFEAKVKEWLENILKENKMVKKEIVGYLKHGQNQSRLNKKYNESNDVNYEEASKKIADIIIDQMKKKFDSGKIWAAPNKSPDGPTDCIKYNLEYIKGVCDKFAESLNGKLEEDGIYKGEHVIDKISAAIKESGDDSKALFHKPPDDNYTFTFAVRNTLAALSSTAKRFADELNKFALTKGKPSVGDSNTNLAANLDAALKVATDMDTAFEKALERPEPGSTSNTHKIFDPNSADLEANIQKTISEALDKQIGPTGDGGDDMGKIKTLEKLTTSFTKPSGRTSKKEELTTAINEISSQTDEAFLAANTATGNAVKFDTLSKEIKEKLTKILNAFAAKGKEVKDALQKFKVDNIGKKMQGVTVKDDTLQKLHDDLLELQSVTLDKVIKATTELMKVQVPKFREACINTLQGHVDQQVEDAITKLTTLANKNYVTSVKEMLQAFASRVQKILQPLPTAIDTDRKEGFKGFMRTFEGKITDNATTDENIKKLKDLADQQADSAEQKAKLFKTLSAEFQKWYNHINTYILGETKREHGENMQNRNPPVDGESNPHPCVEHLGTMKNKLDTLLNHLSALDNPNRKYIFDTTFQEHLSALHALLTTVRPDSYSAPSNPLLDLLTRGLTGMYAELEKAYISTYDSQPWQAEEGEKYAKVCLSIMDGMQKHLGDLSRESNSNNNNQINLSNGLGNAFFDRGFKVATAKDKQDGELKNDINMQGNKIRDLCYNKIIVSTSPTKEFLKIYFPGLKDNVNLKDILDVLYTMLVRYREVRHLRHIPGAKPPTTVCQMLQWLAGLSYNRIYTKLEGKFAEFFDNKEKDKSAKIPIEVAMPSRRSEKMLRSLTFDEMSDLFNNITIRPYHILVTILGNGHADGRYACDFLTNPDDLFYPSDTDQCLDMLVEICLRLNEQILFLFKQCQNGPGSSGWRDCLYGRGVGGYAWTCNDKPCANQNCSQIANQMHNQTPNQKTNRYCGQQCDQHPKCGLKSPLQSFLEDGLVGFLPHSFTTPGCKLTCTVSNHKGLPCKTPMGFKDLSQMASRTGSGRCIKDVLDPFCGTRECSLSLICSYFIYLLHRPPQTLGDMFAFYYNILDHWCDDHSKQKEHRRQAFDDAVERANLGRPHSDLDITKILGSKIHSSDNHPKGDLFSLLSCDPETTPSFPCGSYLQSMSDDTRLLYSKGYADNYLSWIVYITETFYELLKQLYSECCTKCNTQGTRCHDKSCVEGCKVKSAYQSDGPSKQLTGQKHEDKCHSIVTCRDTHPTLYTYGFTFGSPWNLSGKGSDPNQKRTCQDLCQALEKVCHGRSVLADLVINKIPAFLWEIRYKFFYTLLALWSLSLLYLLHIAVVRLDVLRIRYHLRSPASHRIAAQSLLAAARVRALPNVKYFSP
ncbi:hypothetical protein, conserved [Babesia ovata]|uniref:C3H1-type domain-containing protein n=1 Tax=Babesia ovata TaxID=189622 RepID=A0A2H6KK68_9APIC|nr:uncharacterized protein BOVATA_048750 [Babesia ovata]GBE63382.1 hypothetical protein, conserved [Babesia ovata]